MISVVVPLGGDCPHRARAWQWVRAQYEGLEVCEGYGNPDRWCKAQAVADGLSRASGDPLVIADADVWSDYLKLAVEAVESGQAKYAVPHRRVRRLTEQGTERFLDGERDAAQVSENHQSVLGGGIVVLRRETYEQIPLDPRFVGWGGEDHSWGAALRTLAGKPFIGRYPLWHLWHPPQQRMTRKVGNAANEELRARYLRAQGSTECMSKLIEEARCLSTGSSRPH